MPRLRGSKRARGGGERSCLQRKSTDDAASGFALRSRGGARPPECRSRAPGPPGHDVSRGRCLSAESREALFRRFQITGRSFSRVIFCHCVHAPREKNRSDVPRISHRGSHTTMRARANTAMAPNDDRGDDTCESDRIAPDARRTDSEHPDSDTPLEPITSNEELERFASFTEAVRDALGESGRIKELRPDEAAERGCLSTLRSLHRRGRAELTVNLCTSAAKGGQLEVLEWLRENECPWDRRRARRRRLAATSRCCSGRARTTARGTRRRARRRRMLQWARENGCPWNEKTCTSRCCSGRAPTRPWDEDTCCRGGAATSRCCSGRARTAARGTSTRAGRGEGRPPRGAAVGA